MRIFLKSLIAIIILSFVFSMLAGCPAAPMANSGNTQQPGNQNSGKGDSTPKLPQSEYPAMPEAVMQAELKKIDGSPLKLADYKGKVLLVNIWATWCGPCRKEMPELVKLQDAYRASGFEIVGLNLDPEEDAEMIDDFGKKMNLNYELAMGEKDLFNEFLKLAKVDAIPQNFLIDREGRLTGVWVGGGSNVPKLVEAVNKIMAQ